MSILWFRGAVALGIALCTAHCALAQPQVPETITRPDHEAAIRKSASEFVQAFNRGDAAAIAAHFLPTGVYVDDSGRRVVGREAIRTEYEALFAQDSKRSLLLEVDSIQFVNSTTAIEEGRLAVMPQPVGENRVMSHYTAVHVFQDNRWQIAHVHDVKVQLPPAAGQLQDLAWLVGTWRAESDGVTLEVKFRWIQDQHYLERSHTASESGKVTSSATQIIGQDPQTGQVTAWSFASDGGRAVDVWFPTDDGWMIRSNGLLADGTPTVATNYLSKQDEDTIAWRSVDRTVRGASIPDLQEMTIKRQ